MRWIILVLVIMLAFGLAGCRSTEPQRVEGKFNGTHWVSLVSNHFLVRVDVYPTFWRRHTVDSEFSFYYGQDYYVKVWERDKQEPDYYGPYQSCCEYLSFPANSQISIVRCREFHTPEDRTGVAEEWVVYDNHASSCQKAYKKAGRPVEVALWTDLPHEQFTAEQRFRFAESFKDRMSRYFKVEPMAISVRYDTHNDEELIFVMPEAYQGQPIVNDWAMVVEALVRDHLEWPTIGVSYYFRSR